MGGGLMQLVAYGAQDVYLTGNPQITFFKVVYRRHTNFAVEPIQQVFNGAPDFGRTVSCNLNRNGDLITNMYSVVILNDLSDGAGDWAYVRRLGYALVQETKVEIGGSKIDEQYGDWLNIWYELSHKVGQERGHGKLIGDSSELTTLAGGISAPTSSVSSIVGGNVLYIPLTFWFNRFNGLALPLIALQYHDVRITIQYLQAAQCVNYTTLRASAPKISMDDSYLLIDYVYLDSEERKRFAQASHEYLIEQLQFTGSETVSANNKYRLNFNHPSKYLIWVVQNDRFTSGNEFLEYAGNGDWEAARTRFAQKIVYAAPSDGVAFDLIDSGKIVASTAVTGTSWQEVVLAVNNVTMADMTLTLAELDDSAAVLDTTYGAAGSGESVKVYDWFNYGLYIDGTGNPVIQGKLQLNGHDRFQERDGNYFNYVQPYQHFSNTPADGINVYSFALKPEDHQPSGSCNFSRIDNATLNVQVQTHESLQGSSISSGTICNIYTVNYNVLRVMSGMAGTAYSN
jgi:hypothetical protein